MLIDNFLDYIQFERRYSPHTLKAYQTDISTFVDYISVAQSKPFAPEQTTYKDVRQWSVSLLNAGISPRTIHRKLSALTAFFDFLHKQGLVESNPAKKSVKPKLSSRLVRFVPEKDMLSFFRNFEFTSDFCGKRDQLILELLYGTGMRQGELINLQLRDIDFYDQHLKINGKGNKQRLIPISARLISVLNDYLNVRQSFVSSCDNNFLIVTNNGQQAYGKHIYRIVNKYLTYASSVEKKSPHILRHSFATHLLNNGASLDSIKELLGHSSLAATQVYTHNSFKQLIKVYKQAHPRAQKEA